MYDASGLTIDLGLDCLLPWILDCTVWYCLHEMFMFISFVYLLCFGITFENLDDGLIIPFDAPFVSKFDDVLRLGGFDCRSLLRTTYDEVFEEV